MSMFKSVPVAYPKRRKKKDELVISEIQEPVRKTMYDVAMENFRALERVTFMHRIIYAGEHRYQDDESEIEILFRRIIDTVNDSYTPEMISGFLLCYTDYFIHMVEGDEDSINRHLALLLNSPERATNLGVIKLLIHVSHISRRLMKNWSTYYGIPAQYLGKINIDSDLEQSARHVYNCIRKTYNLVFCYNKDDYCKGDEYENSICPVEDEPPTADTSFGRSFKFKSEIKQSNVSVRTTNQLIGSSPMDPYRSTLPEYEIVDFAIKTSFTEDIEKYSGIYGVVPQRLLYRDNVWPYHKHNIPYDVFSKPYDTITELPRTGKAEEKESTEVSADGNEPVEGNAGK